MADPPEDSSPPRADDTAQANPYPVNHPGHRIWEELPLAIRQYIVRQRLEAKHDILDHFIRFWERRFEGGDPFKQLEEYCVEWFDLVADKLLFTSRSTDLGAINPLYEGYLEKQEKKCRDFLATTLNEIPAEQRTEITSQITFVIGNRKLYWRRKALQNHLEQHPPPPIATLLKELQRRPMRAGTEHSSDLGLHDRVVAPGGNLTKDQQDRINSQVPPPGYLKGTGVASRGEEPSPTEPRELPTAGSPDKGNLDLGGVARDPIEKARWAVCPRRTEGALLPEWFHREDDARKWRNEIVVPATILGDEEILPPDPESGFGHARIVRPSVPIRCSSRRDAGGDEWIVIERTDGKPISNGIGAFWRGKEGFSDILPSDLPQGYLKETRRRDQGWSDLVPINWIDERMGDPYAGRTFREFLPLDRVSSVQATDLDADFEEISEKRCADVACDLGDDWQFDRLQAGANKREGHMFRGRKIESLPHQLIRIAYDLETALATLHPDLPSQAIAAFWTSWRAWHHIAICCPRILREMLHKSRSASLSQGASLLQGTGESMAVRFVCRQLCAYAQEVKDWRAMSHSTGTSTGAERPRAPMADDPGREERRASDAPADQSAALAHTAEGASAMIELAASDHLEVGPLHIANVRRAIPAPSVQRFSEDVGAHFLRSDERQTSSAQPDPDMVEEMQAQSPDFPTLTDLKSALNEPPPGATQDSTPAEKVRGGPEDALPASRAAREERLFRKRQDYWELVFAGKSVHVRDSKGMGYIAHLLRSPNQYVHSLQLLMAAAGEQITPALGSAGEVLDKVGFAQYRSRVEDLENQLAEAERNQDQGRKEIAQEELNQLEQQIVSASGLGGRRRNANDDHERIRKGVANAISRAISSIRQHNTLLADHLELHVKRGSSVRYRSDGVDWSL